MHFAHPRSRWRCYLAAAQQTSFNDTFSLEQNLWEGEPKMWPGRTMLLRLGRDRRSTPKKIVEVVWMLIAWEQSFPRKLDG